jgi:hypothetical protein
MTESHCFVLGVLELNAHEKYCQYCGANLVRKVVPYYDIHCYTCGQMRLREIGECPHYTNWFSGWKHTTVTYAELPHNSPTS